MCVCVQNGTEVTSTERNGTEVTSPVKGKGWFADACGLESSTVSQEELREGCGSTVLWPVAARGLGLRPSERDTV